jgi:predicted transcriptional regulator
MPVPEGSLTPAQFEIMRAVWSAGTEGITVAAIWQQIAGERSIGRTTVLNQVDRLEGRGWLRRLPGEGTLRFVATVPQEEVRAQLAADFVADFFEGSASDLISTILGSGKLDPADIQRLRDLVKRHSRESRKGEQET